ncbi:MAG: hypothetical protein LBC77_01265 [Spirochaetaceae bacterium]|nr:hypothetical protein [Spirochaetaceae bacterium]
MEALSEVSLAIEKGEFVTLIDPSVLLLDEPLGALKRIELQHKLREIWTESGATFVMVTHDVDEAIALSSRIVIMTPRPGKIDKIIDVELSGARGRNNDDFIALRKRILEALHLVSARAASEYEI